MLRPNHLPDCCATEPSCGSARPSGPGILATSPMAQTLSKPGTERSGVTSMRPPRPGVAPPPPAIADADSPPPQITVRVGNTVPSDRVTDSGLTSVTVSYTHLRA